MNCLIYELVILEAAIIWLVIFVLLLQGNHSVIKSPDEYTVVVETQRGPKDFQYDQVFTPDHGQEKVFEDTNVSFDTRHL